MKRRVTELEDDAPRVEVVAITDLIPDDHNANEGTERGLSMLDDSLSEVGLGRGVFTDKNRKLIGGNKTQSGAVERGFKRAIIVHTRGDELVVTQRDDLDFDSTDPAIQQRTRKAAYLDNRVGEVDLQWSQEVMIADLKAGVDLSGMFSRTEFEILLEGKDLAGVFGDDGEEDEEIEDGDGQRSDGSLLKLANVTIADPTHVVAHGEVWTVGRHVMIIADILTDWPLWSPYLTDAENDLFVPYPGPFVPLTLKAETKRLVMVQPDKYIAGHILDRFVEQHGADSVSRHDQN